MKIYIKHRINDSVLFSHEADENSLKITLEMALKAGADLRYANLSGADLVRADLTNADLRYANLSGADLRCVNLVGSNLSGASLVGAKLSGADLVRANLVDAGLTRANLVGAILYGEKLSQNPNTIPIRNGSISAVTRFLKWRPMHWDSGANGKCRCLKCLLLEMFDAHAAKASKK